MVKAFQANQETATAVNPETLIAILSTGDPGPAYTYIRRLIQKHGGTMQSVSDHQAFATMRSLAKSEGLAVEPAAAVAFSGLEKMVREGIIRPGEIVVVNCTGHTFPAEKHVLGEHWAVDLSLEEKSRDLHEGLHAALERLDEKTTTVLVIDDNPNDALLIRRFLEARKNYRVFHAQEPWDGLSQAKQRLPDLIILDLTMPELDGFSVMEKLKLDQRTRKIPIIVVSAKDINEEDRARMNGYIEAIYQKGSLPPRAFVDQVVEVIENKSVHKGES